MKRVIIPLFLAAAMAQSVVASESNLYLGVGYGQADYEGETIRDIALQPGQKLEDSAQFAEIYLGFQVSKHVALELGYADFGKVEETYRLNSDIVYIVSPNDTEEVDAKRLSLSTLLSYPANDSLNLFVLLGYAYFDVDRRMSGGFSPSSGGLSLSSSEHEGGMLYGLGARYQLSDRFALRLQWTDANADDLEAQTFGLSFEVKY